MKNQILSILRHTETVMSGEKLSRRLGISRVSIWKHICKLKELGYLIESSPKGYRLAAEIDALYPWEFSNSALTIHYFDTVDSTMDVARDLARKGCPDFTVVIAAQQHKGRGRLNRIWLSDPGGLYFTMVLRPQIPAILSARVNFAAAMILARTLRNAFGVEAMVKWPNDILVDDRKLSGMLSEMEAEAEWVSFVNIGMGINVNNDPTSSEPKAISLRHILGTRISKKDLLSAYLDEFEAYLHSPGLAAALDKVIAQWKQYAATLNRRVSVVTDREKYRGLAVDVDENGALVLELEDGSIQRLVYGDCFHR